MGSHAIPPFRNLSPQLNHSRHQNLKLKNLKPIHAGEKKEVFFYLETRFLSAVCAGTVSGDQKALYFPCVICAI